MYKIALTGGIGTGKTYLSKQFVQMGIPVFYADDEAKKIYQDPKVKQSLCQVFGTEILFSDGSVNLPKLSTIVFSDEQQLQRLNALVHPWVMEQFEKWAEQQNAPTVMMESAIIFECNLNHLFDKIIVVDAPLELRIQRISKRNPELTRDDILQRMSRQMPQETKCQQADLVICTGETYGEALRLQKDSI